MKKNELRFTKSGTRENLEVNGVGDSSYKYGERLIGGNIVLLRNKKPLAHGPLILFCNNLPQKRFGFFLCWIFLS